MLHLITECSLRLAYSLLLALRSPFPSPSILPSTIQQFSVIDAWSGTYSSSTVSLAKFFISQCTVFCQYAFYFSEFFIYNKQFFDSIFSLRPPPLFHFLFYALSIIISQKTPHFRAFWLTKSTKTFKISLRTNQMFSLVFAVSIQL